MRELNEINHDLDLCNQKIVKLLNQHLSLKAEAMDTKKARKLPLLLSDQGEGGVEQKIFASKDSPYEEEIQDLLTKIELAGKRVGSKCLFDFNIALIGFMGAGKSTVSRYLKDMLAMEEVDVDAMIVKDQNMAIKDIFAEHGEAYFRRCESDAILLLKDCKQSVISCGGGAVIKEENVTNLKKTSRIVLLTASPETILSRVKISDERPILNGNMNVEFIKELMAKRADYYHKAADVIIETDNKNINQICEELVNALVCLEG
jgi:shikimate kinase